MMPEREGFLCVSERAYRVLLVVYPKEFRDAYGPQMVQVFRDMCRDEVGRAGVVGLVALWARTVLDLLTTAITERSNAAAGGTFVIPFASSPRMVRRGGVAAITGGVLGIASIALMDLSFVYTEEPILNALSRYENGSAAYPWFIILLHPLIPELLGTLAALLMTIGYVGLYALISHRSGKMALWGGLLACLWVALLVVFAGSNAYRLSAAFGGNLGWISTDPLILLVDLGTPIALIGSLLLGVATLQTGALGRWSILPLALLPLGVLLRLFLVSLGFPVGDFPQAVREGIGTVLIVGLPSVLPYLGWMLIGYLLWSAARQGYGRPALAGQS